jgi:c-di-GMP-binding flagellar brake protein YcgR
MTMKGFGSGQFDRRQYPRLDFVIPMAFQTAEQTEGSTANVSLGGMMAYFPDPVTKGQILAVNMLLPGRDGKRSFRAEAEVVWVQTGRFEGGWTCQAGLRFIGMPADSLALWRQFLVEWQGQKKEE